MANGPDYPYLLKQFNPLTADELPPMAPFARQSPGFPSDLATSLMQSMASGEAAQRQQDEAAARIAASKKEVDPLDQEYKRLRNAEKLKKFSTLAENKYVLKAMSVLTAKTNNLSRLQIEADKGNALAKAQIPKEESEIKAMTKSLSPYLGTKETDVAQELSDFKEFLNWTGATSYKPETTTGFESTGQFGGERAPGVAPPQPTAVKNNPRTKAEHLDFGVKKGISAKVIMESKTYKDAPDK